MHIVVVGLSHKTAPVEIREKLAVPESRLGEALTRLCAYQGIKEGMLLSTCNRVEVYAVVEDLEAGYSRIQEFLADAHLSVASEQLTPHLYWQTGDRAITHLFRVACSLDSMVVGESQILGQVKDAFETALTHKTTGLILNKVVKKAISVAKRVRTDTRIAETAVSVSYAAVELAKKIFSDLRDKTVLLVGAGEMAKLAARHFIAAGVRHVLVTTRTPQHAVVLGRPVQRDRRAVRAVPGGNGHGRYRARLDGRCTLSRGQRRRSTSRQATHEPAHVLDRHFRSPQHRSGGPTR